MVEDALAAGGIVKINTDVLKNFASMNLKGFLDEFDDNVHVEQIKSFSQGASGGPTLSPSRHFVTLLPGNTSQLGSAGKLQAGFQATSGYVMTTVNSLIDNAEKMQADLVAMADMIDEADNEAGLTAKQMQTGLSDVNGATTTGPATT